MPILEFVVTFRVNNPAAIIETPPIIRAYTGWFSNRLETIKPKIVEATICGITIKKVKTPI